MLKMGLFKFPPYGHITGFKLTRIKYSSNFTNTEIYNKGCKYYARYQTVFFRG